MYKYFKQFSCFASTRNSHQLLFIYSVVLTSHCNYINQVCHTQRNTFKCCLELLRQSSKMYVFSSGVSCDMKNNDCHIPLLDTVFEAFPNIPINVDIKTNSDLLIDKVSVGQGIIVAFFFPARLDTYVSIYLSDSSKFDIQQGATGFPELLVPKHCICNVLVCS